MMVFTNYGTETDHMEAIIYYWQIDLSVHLGTTSFYDGLFAPDHFAHAPLAPHPLRQNRSSNAEGKKHLYNLRPPKILSFFFSSDETAPI